MSEATLEQSDGKTAEDKDDAHDDGLLRDSLRF